MLTKEIIDKEENGHECGWASQGGPNLYKAKTKNLGGSGQRQVGDFNSYPQTNNIVEKMQGRGQRINTCMHRELL